MVTVRMAQVKVKLANASCRRVSSRPSGRKRVQGCSALGAFVLGHSGAAGHARLGGRSHDRRCDRLALPYGVNVVRYQAHTETGRTLRTSFTSCINEEVVEL